MTGASLTAAGTEGEAVVTASPFLFLRLERRVLDGPQDVAGVAWELQPHTLTRIDSGSPLRMCRSRYVRAPPASPGWVLT